MHYMQDSFPYLTPKLGRHDMMLGDDDNGDDDDDEDEDDVDDAQW